MGSYGAVDHCVTMILNVQGNNMLAKSVEVYSTLFDVSECSRIDIRLDTSRTTRMGSNGLNMY